MVLTITNKKKIVGFLIKVKLFYAHFEIFFHPHTELLALGGRLTKAIFEISFQNSGFSYFFELSKK